MSLVEQALRKIQQSRGTVPAAAVPAQPAPAAPPPPQVARQSSRSRKVQVDRDALRSDLLLPPHEQERQITNQLRNIKRPLIARALGRDGELVPQGRLVMIASALPGEGKTFTSINLALALALEKDTSVLLVDADVAKPHLSDVFGMRQDPGLLDLLRDDSRDVESVILDTNVPGLSLMSAGQQSSTATELLASARMQQVAEQLLAQDPRRIVIFDSPPVLFTSEARVLAALVGQIAVVVRASGTPQQALLDALDLLPENKPVGLILNQSDEGTTSYYGYYGERSEEQDAVSS